MVPFFWVRIPVGAGMAGVDGDQVEMGEPGPTDYRPPQSN